MQLTGDGNADVRVVDEARLGAEGEVNSYLARRYQVPIDLVAHPDLAGVLMSISLDIAEFRLRARKPPVAAEATAMRDQAIVWLKRVADGVIELPSDVSANTDRGIIAEVVGDERVLSRDEMSDF